MIELSKIHIPTNTKWLISDGRSSFEAGLKYPRHSRWPPNYEVLTKKNAMIRQLESSDKNDAYKFEIPVFVLQNA